VIASVLRRVLIAILVLTVEFAALEGGLRLYGALEGSTTFQSLFMDDPAVGVRLRPNTSIRYTTVEFTTDIAVNGQGVRDDDPIGPKPPGERRVVVLGDSLVLSVQVAQAQTFCEDLERRLNAQGGPDHWRVINAGVQGYGPVQEWFFFDRVAAAFQPDVVLVVTFVGNDAIEAADGAASLEAGQPIEQDQPSLTSLRRLIRSSVVLQSVRIRLDQLRGRLTTGTPERPLATYLADPPPIVQQGLDVSRQAIARIADRAAAIGARTGIVLMPARFQTDDPDYGRLSRAVGDAGGTLVRDAASARFHDALAPLGLPMVDLLPALKAQPERMGLFFQRTVHLTPRGHDVVAGALFDFLASSGLTGPR
jgi:lysophospholipase L1-like esterase